MNDEALFNLAQRAGLLVHWRDYRGAPHAVARDTLQAVLGALDLPCRTPAQTRESLQRVGQDETGYHRLRVEQSEMTLAVAPPRAFGIDELAPGRRLWGLAVQLHALRRPGDGGIGDFTALAEFVQRAARRGADAVAISPVHAGFAADPSRYSPYAPSTRLFLNALYADAASLVGSERLPVPPARLEAAELIDWPAAAKVRMARLRCAFDILRAQRLAPDSDDPLAQDLREFRRRGGEALEDHARFETICAQLSFRHWREWPAALRDPRAPAVDDYAHTHSGEVDFHVFLQWLAARGLTAAQAAARDAGMKLGLIADLAVGTDSGGSHAWSRQRDMLIGLSVGAPPDLLNLQGQDWGLTTFSPRALRLHGYAPFLEMLRATLRNAGGLRIDHVLGLNRLWLIPDGASPAQGVYLRYPLEDLLRLLALESWRHRAVIVGEDLGTVPEGFGEQLATAGLMGLRVLWFEREHGLFVEPTRWPREVLATTATHDLPTVAGWWQGRDLDWRTRLGLFRSAQEAAAERGARVHDRRALWAAFEHAGLVQGDLPEHSGPVVDAAIRFIARTPAQLAIVPIEDLAGLDEQPNLPGTTAGHPNWRRRLPAPAATLLDTPAVAARLAALRAERGA